MLDRFVAWWKKVSTDWYGRIKYSLRYRSVQLAILAGGLGGYFQSYPDQYQGLIGMIPEVVRPFVGIIVFGILPLIARVIRQDGVKDTPPSSS